jgi:hypothetical protein
LRLAALDAVAGEPEPHQGSPFADLIDTPERLAPFGQLPFGSHPNLLQPALDALGTSLDALRNLTTAYCKQFSATYTNHPSPWPEPDRKGCSILARSFSCFRTIAALTGPANDGLVTRSSAQWGQFDENTWRADHADEVGTNLDTLGPSSFPLACQVSLDRRSGGGSLTFGTSVPAGVHHRGIARGGIWAQSVSGAGGCRAILIDIVPVPGRLTVDSGASPSGRLGNSLLALDVHRVVGYGLCRDFLEPVRRLCRNSDHVAFAHMVGCPTFE